MRLRLIKRYSRCDAQFLKIAGAEGEIDEAS
jgi:hypothetical protein